MNHKQKLVMKYLRDKGVKVVPLENKYEYKINIKGVDQDMTNNEFQKTVLGFIQEQRTFNKEMIEFKEEMTEFKEEMTEFKQEMTEFKEEMTEFKDLILSLPTIKKEILEKKA